jgi:hypothetical protein
MLRFRRPAIALLVLVASWPTLAWGQAVKAGIVTTMQGSATATRTIAALPVALKFKDDVFLHDRIATGDRSLARLLLGGKAVVTIRERSLLTITEVPGRSTIDIQSGKLSLAIARERMRPGEVLDVRTPNAVAAVRGTVLIVEVGRVSAQIDAGVVPVVTVFSVVSDLSGKGVEVTQFDPVSQVQVGTAVTLGLLQSLTIPGAARGSLGTLSPDEVAAKVADLQVSEFPPSPTSDTPIPGQHMATAAELVSGLFGTPRAFSLQRLPTPDVVDGIPRLPCGDSSCEQFQFRPALAAGGGDGEPSEGEPSEGGEPVVIVRSSRLVLESPLGRVTLDPEGAEPTLPAERSLIGVDLTLEEPLYSARSVAGTTVELTGGIALLDGTVVLGTNAVGPLPDGAFGRAAASHDVFQVDGADAAIGGSALIVRDSRVEVSGALVSVLGGDSSAGLRGTSEAPLIDAHQSTIKARSILRVDGAITESLLTRLSAPRLARLDGVDVDLESAFLSATSHSTIEIDPELARATAPILGVIARRTDDVRRMATGGHLTDLVPADAVLVMNNGSQMIIRSGSLVELAGATTMRVSGHLALLSGGSTLDILAGALVAVSGGAAFSLTGGSLVAFGTGAASTLSIRGTPLGDGILAKIPHFTGCPGGPCPVLLRGGAQAEQVVVGTGFEPFKGVGTVSLGPSAAVLIVDGPGSTVTLKP